MSDEYEVGYGKPPRATRFRKGQSGNPQGRPKGSANTATIFLRVSRQLVTVKEGGTTRQVPKLEIALTQLVNKAAGGDLKAIQLLLLLTRVYDESAEDPQDDGPDRVKNDATMRRLLARMQQVNGNEPEAK